MRESHRTSSSRPPQPDAAKLSARRAATRSELTGLCFSHPASSPSRAAKCSPTASAANTSRCESTLAAILSVAETELYRGDRKEVVPGCSSPNARSAKGPAPSTSNTCGSSAKADLPDLPKGRLKFAVSIPPPRSPESLGSPAGTSIYCHSPRFGSSGPVRMGPQRNPLDAARQELH